MQEPIKLGKVIIPPFRPRRRWWHMLKERATRVPIDKTLVGKDALVERVIMRTGYYFEYTDVGYLDLKDVVDNIMVAQLGRAFGYSKNITPESYRNAAIRMADIFGRGMLNRAIYQARKAWLNEIYNLEDYKAYAHMRAFWYVDVQDVNTEIAVWVKLTGVKQHVTGKHYPAYHGSDFNDYEPGGLSHGLQQAVYSANGLVARNCDDFYDGPVEIHPLDILQVRG